MKKTGLKETLIRFEKRNEFLCNVLYINYNDYYFYEMPDNLKYKIIFSDVFPTKGHVFFLGSGIHDTWEILTDNDYIIKNIIE